MPLHPILDHPALSQRYFFPRPDAQPDPTWVEAEGARLRCAHFAPHPAAPTVLHFHGNGEVVRDWCPVLPDAFAAWGLNTFLAEYRGYGGSTGAPSLTPLLGDALTAADAAGDPRRLLVYGRSVGSLYALHVAAHRPVGALIIESGIADVHERIRLRLRPEQLGTDAAGLRAAVDAHFDHRAKLAAFTGPVLVLHARGDDLVGPHHGQQLAEWAGDRAALHLYARGDHNSIHAHNGPDIVRRVADLAGRLG